MTFGSGEFTAVFLLTGCTDDGRGIEISIEYSYDGVGNRLSVFGTLEYSKGIGFSISSGYIELGKTDVLWQSKKMNVSIKIVRRYR